MNPSIKINKVVVNPKEGVQQRAASNRVHVITNQEMEIKRIIHPYL
jgi:hypothetical protein